MTIFILELSIMAAVHFCKEDRPSLPTPSTF
jgi:hypothetical protein